ncbi:MAG: ABC transporter permease [Acetobacteraceae bacterium]|nr:ABC transporter permease [Acetobacteraceae bacterium]
MQRFITRRLALTLLVLWGTATIAFVLARVVPSDPAARWVGPRATLEQVEQARKELGLDQPLYVQYYRYMRGLLRGDWGVSIRTHQPVIQDMLGHLPASLELVLASMILALLVGIPLGVASAIKKDRAVDHLGRVLSIGAVSLPPFWLAMILQLVFFKWLGLLPLGRRLETAVRLAHPLREITGLYSLDALVTGNWPVLWDSLLHLALPAVTLASYTIGVVTRMTRSSLLEVLNEDYIRAARSYGLPERVVVLRYALKNAIAPTVTVLALCLAYSLVGTFVIEAVFAWPGLGYYMAQSVIAVDYTAIIGCTVLVAAAYALLNLGVDIVHALLDPRISLG